MLVTMIVMMVIFDLLHIGLNQFLPLNPRIRLVVLLKQVIDAVLRKYRLRKHLEHLCLVFKALLFLVLVDLKGLYAVPYLRVASLDLYLTLALLNHLILFDLLCLVLHRLGCEVLNADLSDTLHHFGGHFWVRIFEEAVPVTLKVSPQDCNQEVLFDGALPLAGLEANLHPELHHEEVEVDPLEHGLNGH